MDKQDKTYRRFKELLAKVRINKISENEMREVKQLAETDPFWQDALDGYMRNESPVQHEVVLKRLKANIEARTVVVKEKRRGIPIWLRAAAAIVVIGSGAWLIGNIVRQNTLENAVAHQELPADKESSAKQSFGKADMKEETAAEIYTEISSSETQAKDLDFAPPNQTEAQVSSRQSERQRQDVVENEEIKQDDVGRQQPDSEQIFLENKKELSGVASADLKPEDTLQSKGIEEVVPKSDDLIVRILSDREHDYDGILIQSAMPVPDSQGTFDQTARLQDYGAVSNAGGLRPNQVGYSIIGKVLDPDGFPLIGANVMEENTDNGVVTDIDGRFFLTLQDTNHALNVAYVGYADLTYELEQRRDGLELILQESSLQLSEVVVVGYGKKSGKARSKENVDEKEITAEPSGGFKKLNMYIVQNCLMILGRESKGEFVTVEFIVDEQSKLSEFEVINASDREIASVVISLLKDGPKWKTKPRGEQVLTTYTIRF